MTAKMPLSGSNSTPKSAWNFTDQPSPQTLVFLSFESLMMPWALPISLGWVVLVREPPTYNPRRRTSSSAVIVAPLKPLASWSARNLAALTMSSGVAQVETSASGR